MIRKNNKRNDMKITLEFKDEDAEEALTALDGYKWKLAVWDLDQYMRSEIKYNTDLTDEASEALENCRDKIRRLLEEYNLKLD